MLADESLISDNILNQIDDYNRAKKVVEVDEERISFLIFQLDEHLFAFTGCQARQILAFAGITWIPGATAFIPGVINTGGDVAAVLDLHQILGTNKTGQETTGTYLVMVRAGDERNGILVDNIVDILEVPVSENRQILPTLDERFRRFATSQFDYVNKLVTVLDAALIIEKVTA